MQFTVNVAIAGAQPNLVNELDAASTALGRPRVADEIWMLCDLAIARRRGLWFVLLGDEFLHRAAPLKMPHEIDDAAGYNARTLTLPGDSKVEIRTHMIVFAIASAAQISVGAVLD